MDPLSAIIAALIAGAAEAAKPTAVQVVKDAYAGLKSLVIRKLGGTAGPVQALEEKPASGPRQDVLKEELGDARADQDRDILKALQALIDALRQHAPQSVSSITYSATTTGGNSIQGATIGGSVHQSGDTTINTGGGASVQGGVNTAGGAFIGRDQRITNITINSIDKVQDLVALLQAAQGRLTRDASPEALDSLAVVLDEISKLYQLMDSELTRYLSLSLAPEHSADERAVLLSLDGGQITTRASEARGHCHKIATIYSHDLRSWFGSRLPPAEMSQVDHAFGVLGSSDTDMTYVIHQLSQWLSDKATTTLDRLDAGDLAGAKALVKNARLDALPMRQKLARTISSMRDMQAELLRLTI